MNYINRGNVYYETYIQFVFYNYYYNRNSIEKKDKSDEIHMTQQGK